MPERDAHDIDPAAPERGSPATPRVSGESAAEGQPLETPPPESSTRTSQEPDEPSVVYELRAASVPSDTLLSAGKPAARLEVLLEDRLAVIDERLRDLDARVAVMELKKSIAAPESRQKPWLWIAFLIALVVVFQLLHSLQ